MTVTVASYHPRAGQWRCLWDGCAARGHWTTPPEGVAALEDVQAHHEHTHGVAPHLAPSELEHVDRGRLAR